jgi:hypothetical protein
MRNLSDIQSERYESDHMMGHLLNEMELREKFDSDTVKIQLSMLKDAEFLD